MAIGSGFRTLKRILSQMNQPSQSSEDSGNYSDRDLAYMQSLSAAVTQHAPIFTFWIIGSILSVLLLLYIWMAWAELDIIVKANGKVIPSSQLQRIQSLEGGVVSEILVKEGDEVKVGQPLMKISDIPFLSSYEENSIKHLELRARIVRLNAEANDIEFGLDETVQEKMPDLLESEKRLYLSNKAQLDQEIRILDEQVKQAENQLLESESLEKQFRKSLALLRKELRIKKPLVDRQVLSEVEYIQLQVKEAETEGELESVKVSLPRIRSQLVEVERKLEHTTLEFRNRARKELNEVVAEVSRINEAQTALADRVARTTLRSSTNGTIKRILVSTIGGVIKSGNDVIEVVPQEDSLLVEAQIRPADIGNVEIGQPTRIKFTAYDFAIYGSVKGTVKYLGADTITNEDGISFYIARVEPEKSYLGDESHQRFIKVGMTSEVDIITGKKTILDHLLKPFNRALDSALREG